LTAGKRRKTPVFTRLVPHHRTPNLKGQKFGELTVLGYAGGDGKKSWWKTRCSCGSVQLHVGAELRKGHTRSCGCRKGEWIRERITRHGRSSHPLHHVWSSMIARCTYPKAAAYPRYGGRGISVCERCGVFENFWEDMAGSWEPGLSLDRIDNAANDPPENCRWATPRQQARNTSKNRMIDTPAGRMLVVEAAELSGINVTTLLYRLGAGWPTNELFRPPDFTNRIG